MTSKGRKKNTSRRLNGRLKPLHRKKIKKVNNINGLEAADWWIEDDEETKLKLPKPTLKQRIFQWIFG